MFPWKGSEGRRECAERDADRLTDPPVAQALEQHEGRGRGVRLRQRLPDHQLRPQVRGHEGPRRQLKRTEGDDQSEAADHGDEASGRPPLDRPRRGQGRDDGRHHPRQHQADPERSQRDPAEPLESPGCSVDHQTEQARSDRLLQQSRGPPRHGRHQHAGREGPRLEDLVAQALVEQDLPDDGDAGADDGDRERVGPEAQVQQARERDHRVRRPAAGHVVVEGRRLLEQERDPVHGPRGHGLSHLGAPPVVAERIAGPRAPLLGDPTNDQRRRVQAHRHCHPQSGRPSSPDRPGYPPDGPEHDEQGQARHQTSRLVRLDLPRASTRTSETTSRTPTRTGTETAGSHRSARTPANRSPSRSTGWSR